MEIKTVKQYFVDWTKNKRTKESYCNFMNMLQSKAYFAGLSGQKVIAFHGERDKKYLEQMLILADDNMDALLN